MSISSVSNNPKSAGAVAPANKSKGDVSVSGADKRAGVSEEQGAVFEKSQPEPQKTTYSAADRASIIKELKSAQDQRYAGLQNLVSELMLKQGGMSNRASDIKLTYDFMSKLNVDAYTRAEAQKAISEDGEFGVKAVADNIMKMAEALGNGDSSKTAELRKAVEKGFAAAEKAWGNKLPDICMKTKEEVMKRFDYLEKNGSLEGYSA